MVNGKRRISLMLIRRLAQVQKLCAVLVIMLAGSFIFASTLRAGGKTEIIKIGGTGCALGGIKAVAQAFEEKHPEIKIKVLPSLGSGGSIKAVLSGAIDLALSSRRLTDAERREGAYVVEYARTPFAFVTAESTEADPLSLQQVAAIYGGDKQQWPDGTPIRIVLRPETDSDIFLLKGMSPDMEKAVLHALRQEGMLVASTDQDNATLLGAVRGAFGACTLAQIQSEKRRLRLLALDGVTPSVANLENGTYPYSKTLFAVTRHSSLATYRFLRYLQSPEGRAILTRTGHLVPSIQK
jgi:phosphate transport system substrate-binding protein